jgi:hypothetical protein
MKQSASPGLPAQESYAFSRLLESESSVSDSIGKLGLKGDALISLYDSLIDGGVAYSKCEPDRQSWGVLFELYKLDVEEHKKRGTLKTFAKNPNSHVIEELANTCMWDDDHGINTPGGWVDLYQYREIIYCLREDQELNQSFWDFIHLFRFDYDNKVYVVDDALFAEMISQFNLREDTVIPFYDKLIESGVKDATAPYPFTIRDNGSITTFHDRSYITIGVKSATNPYPLERRGDLRILFHLYKFAAEGHRKRGTLKEFVNSDSSLSVEDLACAYGQDNNTGKAVPELKELRDLILKLRSD